MPYFSFAQSATYLCPSSNSLPNPHSPKPPINDAALQTSLLQPLGNLSSSNPSAYILTGADVIVNGHHVRGWRVDGNKVTMGQEGAYWGGNGCRARMKGERRGKEVLTPRSNSPNFYPICSKTSIFLYIWDGTKTGVPSEPNIADHIFEVMFRWLWCNRRVFVRVLRMPRK